MKLLIDLELLVNSIIALFNISFITSTIFGRRANLFLKGT